MDGNVGAKLTKCLISDREPKDLLRRAHGELFKTKFADATMFKLKQKKKKKLAEEAGMNQ